MGEQTPIEKSGMTFSDKTMTKRLQDSLFFDGQKLRWYRDNQLYKEWDAMAGKKKYQARKYQSKADGGPLPSGDYGVYQNNLQHRPQSVFDFVNNYNPRGRWPGGRDSWGDSRVWLKPEPQTNTMGRKNFSIHGGKEMESRGCIDLASGMGEFAEKFENYGQDMRLRVRYPKTKW